jgi:hypothetical protein
MYHSIRKVKIDPSREGNHRLREKPRDSMPTVIPTLDWPSANEHLEAGGWIGSAKLTSTSMTGPHSLNGIGGGSLDDVLRDLPLERPGSVESCGWNSELRG